MVKVYDCDKAGEERMVAAIEEESHGHAAGEADTKRAETVGADGDALMDDVKTAAAAAAPVGGTARRNH